MRACCTPAFGRIVHEVELTATIVLDSGQGGAPMASRHGWNPVAARRATRWDCGCRDGLGGRTNYEVSCQVSQNGPRWARARQADGAVQEMDRPQLLSESA